MLYGLYGIALVLVGTALVATGELIGGGMALAGGLLTLKSVREHGARLRRMREVEYLRGYGRGYHL